MGKTKDGGISKTCSADKKIMSEGMAIAALRAQGFVVLDAGDRSPDVRQRFVEEALDQPTDYLRSAVLLRSEADKRLMDDATQWKASFV